jgi:hypothetical protein
MELGISRVLAYYMHYELAEKGRRELCVKCLSGRSQVLRLSVSSRKKPNSSSFTRLPIDSVL